MRNLKTKDYLGKARLVAATDKSNAFTGFTGSEIKNVSSCLIGLATLPIRSHPVSGRQGKCQGRQVARKHLVRRHQPRQAWDPEQTTAVGAAERP